MKQQFKFKFWAAIACSVFAFAACSEKPDENNEPVEPEIIVPDMEEVLETIDPTGTEPLTLTLEIEEGIEWVIEGDDDYDWIEPDEWEGTGEYDMTFTAGPNNSGKERSATYVVYGTYADKAEPLYEIFISQAQNALPFGEGDYAFLKEVVDGQMLGEATPIIADWYNFDPAVMEGTGIGLVNKDGKYYIESLYYSPFVDWPEVTDLTECTIIRIGGAERADKLAGVEISKEWNTPKLTLIMASHTKWTGVIPDGLAASPALAEIYFDGCDFYGALPHNWVSKGLEVVLFAGSSTHACADGAHATTENAGLGYMVPASLDVVLNENRKAQGDRTQMKLGGICDGHWIGFEKGWGQERYEKYNPGAEKGNTAVWDDTRLLIGDPNLKYTFTKKDGTQEEQDSAWAYYFTNLGHSDKKANIPYVMLEWNQADADAYTAQAKAARANK